MDPFILKEKPDKSEKSHTQNAEGGKRRPHMTYRWLGNDDKVPQTTTGPRDVDWMEVWMKMKVGKFL